MRILAIDPGYDRLGIAVIDQTSKETLIYSECLTTSKKDSIPERLRQVGERLVSVIEEFEPGALATEKLFFSKNQKTAMAVAEVRGVILYESAKHRLPLYEYTANQIKVAVCGHGESDKAQVKKMVEILLKMPQKKALDDEYDAIAIGLACLATHKVTIPSYLPQ